MYHRLSIAVFAFLLLGTSVSAQVVAAASPVASALADGEAPLFHVDVSMVNLNITVTDPGGNPVRGLIKEDFSVLEEGAPQSIASFHEDAETPVSVGVLFDVSLSMGLADKLQRVRQAVNNFCNTINPRDEVFLIRFNSKVKLVQDYTDDRKQLKHSVGSLRSSGETALYDAIIEGLQHLRTAKYDKKALLVITDGKDTHSRARLQQVVEAAHLSPALIYGMAIGEGHTDKDGSDPSVDYDTLKTIAAASGGKAFLIEARRDRHGKDAINSAAMEVSAELRDQYTLAYYPPAAKRTGEFRRIKVSNNNPQYAVRARTGYLTSFHPQ